MKIVPNTRAMGDQVQRTADVEDGPVIVITGFTNKGKKFKVTRVIVSYRHSGGAWYCSYVRAVGLVLKLDGTAGKVDAHQEFPDPVITDGTPSWVRKTALHMLPLEPAPSRVDDVLTIAS